MLPGSYLSPCENFVLVCLLCFDTLAFHVVLRSCMFSLLFSASLLMHEMHALLPMKFRYLAIVPIQPFAMPAAQRHNRACFFGEAPGRIRPDSQAIVSFSGTFSSRMPGFSRREARWCCEGHRANLPTSSPSRRTPHTRDSTVTLPRHMENAWFSAKKSRRQE